MFDLLSRPEGIAIIAALIGASSALLGQFVSGMIGIYKEVYLDRRKSKRSARFLALQLVLILDDFCSMCYGAAMNNVPEINPSDEMDFRFRTRAPDLKLPEAAEWELLDAKLTDEVLWLENTLKNVRAAHSSLDAYPPDYGDLFEHRAEDYSKLGITTLDTIERLCKRYKIKSPERPEYYNPREGFTRQLAKMREFWDRREESNRKMFEEIEQMSLGHARKAHVEPYPRYWSGMATFCKWLSR
ncbi:MAG: hypothetical protein ACK40A_07555 [Pannonibacter indicus]